ncbi:Protein kinase domain-containing protein [Trichoderma simmonsii]|uniref:Protein kinase domain-containing protein n=1 Tax=Trichoderma simmonsii TaxID=1491479 RepID=A0A8G0PL00_9HYPO|nr:Protein kinase domain-containing protein [Trichoderma simmonsii]
MDSKNLDWGSPVIFVKQDFLDGLDCWTQSYHPNEVAICYDNPRDILIKPPKRVLIDGKDGSRVECFFKRFETSFGLKHAKMEPDIHKRIVQAQLPPPPKTFICHLHGVVRDGNRLAGMLFIWINNKGVLSKARADQSAVQLRARWATQIKDTLEMLHQRNIIWGDAKDENILIDMDDNAWIVDFGGSYTVGWVDEDKAGTLEGDAQGLARILDILS